MLCAKDRLEGVRIAVERVEMDGVVGWLVSAWGVRTGLFADWNSAVAYGFILLTTEAKELGFMIDVIKPVA
jgi:hypothetical protein